MHDQNHSEHGLSFTDADIRQQVRQLWKRGMTEDEIIAEFKKQNDAPLDDDRPGSPEINDIMRRVRTEVAQARRGGCIMIRDVWRASIGVSARGGWFTMHSETEKERIRTSPGCRKGFLTCKMGEGPVVADLYLSVSGGLSVITMELTAPLMREIIEVFQQSLALAGGTDSPEGEK